MVWDIYDGVRTGIADYQGIPHYFSSIFQDEYTDEFELATVSERFLGLAIEQWKIFRDWEYLFHTGNENLENHPNGGGVNKRYDEIEAIIKSELLGLTKIDATFKPEFRVLPGQDELQEGILREIEVEWHGIT